jgi:tetratricopeptide (TPR) repeat protein
VERNSQLDASGPARAAFPLAHSFFGQSAALESHLRIFVGKPCAQPLFGRRVKGEKFLALLVGLLSVFILPRTLWAQCPADRRESSQIQQLFEQRNWPEVARLAKPLASRPADLNFDYGIALAHLKQWPEARAALMAGRRQCPQQKRFPIELAGIAFERKRYPEAAAWLQRGLKLDPGDDYANNFAGTVYFLMENLNAALKYWNRIQKPYLSALQFDPHLRVQRLILDRSIAFSPAAVLREADFETTGVRLQGLGIFPAYNIALNARPDGSFDAEFHALERDGFGGSPMQALVAIFAGTPYETIYPGYFNMGGSAANLDSLLRWDAQKRRVWFSLSAPLRNSPRRRWQLSADARDETWVIRRSFTGPAPALGSLHLKWQTLTGLVTSFSSGRLQWSTGGELSHSSYQDVVYGPALTPGLVSSGFELKHLASIEDKLVDIPERRFSLTAGAASELARLWSDPPYLFAKLQGSAVADWLPQAQGDNYEAVERLRAGHTYGSAPFDELFMLGTERDNNLWLCGQIGTRDGRKGSSPLGYDYLLSNASLLRRVYSYGLFGVKAGPLLDVGRMSAPTSGLSTAQWLFDAGVEAKLTVMGTSVVLTYGRDLRSGSNAFYGAAAQ